MGRSPPRHSRTRVVVRGPASSCADPPRRERTRLVVCGPPPVPSAFPLVQSGPGFILRGADGLCSTWNAPAQGRAAGLRRRRDRRHAAATLVGCARLSPPKLCDLFHVEQALRSGGSPRCGATRACGLQAPQLQALDTAHAAAGTLVAGEGAGFSARALRAAWGRPGAQGESGPPWLLRAIVRRCTRWRRVPRGSRPDLSQRTATALRASASGGGSVRPDEQRTPRCGPRQGRSPVPCRPAALISPRGRP